MARFLYAIWPFVGHIHPFIGVAQELRTRGHSVAFYTGASAKATIEPEGFPVFPFHKVDEDHVWELIFGMEAAASHGRKPLGGGLRAFSDWLIGTLTGQVSDLQPVIAEWKPDVIIAETAMWGPILVLWESTGIPVAISSTLMGSLIPGRDAPPPGLGLPAPRTLPTRLLARLATLATDVLARGFRRRIDQIRADYGLPPLGCSVNAFTARLPLYLVPSVRELDYDRHDLPPSVHYVGPCIWNKPAQAAPPAWLDELPTDRPWVHVTEGTVHYQEPFVLRAAAQGLANQPVEAILTTGPHRDPVQLNLGPGAPNIRVERWVSHADLLPRCAALVTTGGAGTVMAALQAGVPMVIVPTLWDKADNAHRVVEAGAGLRLSPGACTPGRLRAAVRRVLVEPSFRANARRLARLLAEAPGPARAAELLEQLAPTESGTDV